VLVYLAILLAQAPLFGLVVLGLGALQVVLLLLTTGAMRDLAQRDLKTQAESQSFLVEALAGIATLKASGAEDRAFDHWTNLFFKQLNVSLRRYHLTAVIDTAIRALQTLAPLLLLWLGAGQVLAGRMSLGTMLAVNALAAVFLLPLASLIANGRQLYLVGAHLERLVDVFEAEPEQMPQQDGPAAAPLQGGIELSRVSFRYSPDAPLVLQDISLRIEPGQKVALVGRTGSGKSTLAMLLLGLYVPVEGEIRYDGVPLGQLDYRWLRRQFGVVLQEPFLFSGSVRRNITFNHPELPLPQVEAAAKLAEIHDDVLQMPMQYETLVAEGGGALSGGQRQRLALARALASQPSILLLDEATSHLDTLTEARIDRHLSQLAGTRIVIAHRLSTIYNADQIFVLDQGRIVERGRHAELLALGGVYAELVGSQLAGRPLRQPSA
jgi:ABC-type bacteriocin/lantibiotic exporter with double-glycine peptidase domain